MPWQGRGPCPVRHHHRRSPDDVCLQPVGVTDSQLGLRCIAEWNKIMLVLPVLRESEMQISWTNIKLVSNGIPKAVLVRTF